MVSRTDITPDDLRDALAEIDGKQPTLRLVAAINYLEEDDATMAEVAERYGYTAGWLSRWLDRLERLAEEPAEDVVYDTTRGGRPSELSDEQLEQFVAAVQNSPRDAGLSGFSWSVPLARFYLAEEFDVEYSDRHVRRLLSEAGLSSEVARPDYYKDSERIEVHYRYPFMKSATQWTPEPES